MFKVGDTVSYGTQGACRITSIEKLSLAGTPQEYYILSPEFQQGSKIYVPKANGELTAKIRKILSKEEIFELIKLMPDDDTIWIENDAERTEKYRNIIASGDRRKIAQLIKTFYLEQQNRQKNGRRLRQSDEQLFRRAENVLHSEFALVLNITIEQFVPFLHNQIDPESLNK